MSDKVNPGQVLSFSKYGFFYFLLLLLVSGCLLLGGPPKENPERKLFNEVMTAFNSRAYESSIKNCEQFLADYADSPHLRKDAVLMRLGESYEGLLKRDYLELINKGMDEQTARGSFLAKHGAYNCWEVQEEGLTYNKEVFLRLLKENPESFYADEATYDLIPFMLREKEYQENPARVKNEIEKLNDVLTRFPTTSLRAKILFQMGYRFHVLYEIYSFSPDLLKRDRAKAEENLLQAEYVYKLCLGLPKSSEYSKKALQNLDLLKQGKRVYLK